MGDDAVEKAPPPYTVVMPEDGWDDREVTFYCEFCDRTLVATSVYMNLDALLAMNLTQSEFFREVHRNDHHTYDEATKTWSA